MTEPKESADERRRRGLQTGRLESFSDGVFAIAVTLLVLDIAVPVHAGRDLLPAVANLWPSYLAYVVSFATIGAVWLGHNAITDYIEHVNAGFVRLNLLLLLVVSFLRCRPGCSRTTSVTTTPSAWPAPTTAAPCC